MACPQVIIPPTSGPRKASYLRLELAEGSKILLWSRLHEYPQNDGSRMAAFQIHQDLIGQAYIGISDDAGVKDDGFACHACKVPLAQSVTDTQPTPSTSRAASRPD